jgi:hypothetical protein
MPGASPEPPCGVSETDLDPVFGGLEVSKHLQPLWRSRGPASGVHHQVRRQEFPADLDSDGASQLGVAISSSTLQFAAAGGCATALRGRVLQSPKTAGSSTTHLNRSCISSGRPLAETTGRRGRYPPVKPPARSVQWKFLGTLPPAPGGHQRGFHGRGGLAELRGAAQDRPAECLAQITITSR